MDRQKGGSFEFLKRLHVVEPGYAGITVFSESKHVHTMYDRFAKANGKPAKLSKTPSAPSSSITNVSSQQSLSDVMAAEYRSLVGLAMYVSQQRFDIQYTVKTLASSLKSPTTGAWFELGRLVGYLKQTELHALEMQQTVKGCSFLEALNGGCNDLEGDRPNCLETFSDANWSGSGSQRSISAAVHVLNGLIVHSTSRTQKCISLSSTESEWYAASALCSQCFHI